VLGFQIEIAPDPHSPPFPSQLANLQRQSGMNGTDKEILLAELREAADFSAVCRAFDDSPLSARELHGDRDVVLALLSHKSKNDTKPTQKSVCWRDPLILDVCVLTRVE